MAYGKVICMFKLFFTKNDFLTITNVVKKYRILFSINIVVVLIGACLEGIGVGFLVPVLESLDVSRESDGFFTSFAKEIFAFLNIPYTFLSLILVFSSLILLKYIVLMVQQRLARILSSTVTRDLRCQCTENLLEVSIKYFYGRKLGEIISTIFNSTQNAGGTLEYLVMLVKGIVFSFTYLIVASVLSLELTVTMVVFILIAYFFVWPRFLKGKKYGQKEKSLMDRIHSELQDKFGGIKIVKQFGAENKMYQYVSNLAADYQKNAVKLMDNKIISYAFFEPFLFLLLVCAIIISVELLSMPLATLLVTLLIFTQIIPQFKTINSNLLMVNELIPHYSKVQDLITKNNKPYLLDGNNNITSINNEVKYERVSFAYDESDNYVLENVNITFPVNNVIALVGSSGGGKSTLVELLVRNQDPSIGKILVDGKDLKELKMHDWKSMIGIVDQDCYLFHESVIENIRYGNPLASKDEIINAAKQAYAHDFIENMENGYDTIIGHRGIRMSGGQRQRITLARALVREPKLLVLDEATSALDSESERLIQKSLNQLKGKITIIVIAHRLSTIKQADKIIFMESGKVIESGGHDELMALEGKYKYHVQLQTDG